MTACKNAAEFIDNTLQSVLNQNYPDLEYIVVDGGSTDGTQQIIEPYLDRLAYYVSEPDGGQYEAIQRGLARATGDVMCWLNADDIFYALDTFSGWRNFQSKLRCELDNWAAHFY